MNRRRKIILPMLGAAILGSLLVVVACAKFKKIEKRGPAPEAVAGILPGDVNTVAASISGLFNGWSDFIAADRHGHYQNKFPYGSQWSHFYLFRKDTAQHSLFPTDEEILLDRGVDAYVERYVRISPSLRNQDFYLYEPSGDYYWESEYFYKGQPAKFRCSFLIHLEPAGTSSTKVEVFEYQPTIWAGEYVGLSAHAILPTALHDIRPVQPTTSDRKALLTRIQNAYLSTSMENTK